jgi:hypothetical protein
LKDCTFEPKTHKLGNSISKENLKNFLISQWETEKRNEASIENLKQVLLEIQLENLKNKPKSAKNRWNYLKIESMRRGKFVNRKKNSITTKKIFQRIHCSIE